LIDLKPPLAVFEGKVPTLVDLSPAAADGSVQQLEHFAIKPMSAKIFAGIVAPIAI